MLISKVLKGTWFLPESDIKAKGRLFTKKSEIYLEVLNPLNSKGFPSYESFEFIHGITYDQKPVTLYKCNESLSVIHDEENSITIYRVRFIIENGLFTTGNFLFNCMEFYPSNFEEWLNLKPFKKIKDQDNNLFEHLAIEDISEDIIPGLNLLISFFQNVNTSTTNTLELSTTASIKMTSNKKLSFDDWFEKAMHFSNFLALSYGKFCPVISLCLSNSDVIEKHSMIIDGHDFGHEEVVEHKISYQVEKSFEKNSRFIHHIRMLFLYTDIKSDFATILEKWYAIKDDIRPILNLLLENIFRNGVFNENNFLNSAHALESFHRRFRNNKVLADDAYKHRVKHILDSVDEEYKMWLLPRLEHGNEPSLHARLEEILQEVDGSFIQSAIKEKAKFITQFKNCRNYYTHYDKRLQKKALKPTELFYLARKTDYIVLFLLLKESGISFEKLDRLFSKQLSMGLLFDKYSF